MAFVIRDLAPALTQKHVIPAPPGAALCTDCKDSLLLSMGWPVGVAFGAQGDGVGGVAWTVWAPPGLSREILDKILTFHRESWKAPDVHDHAALEAHVAARERAEIVQGLAKLGVSPTLDLDGRLPVVCPVCRERRAL